MKTKIFTSQNKNAYAHIILMYLFNYRVIFLVSEDSGGERLRDLLRHAHRCALEPLCTTCSRKATLRRIAWFISEWSSPHTVLPNVPILKRALNKLSRWHAYCHRFDTFSFEWGLRFLYFFGGLPSYYSFTEGDQLCPYFFLCQRSNYSGW